MEAVTEFAGGKSSCVAVSEKGHALRNSAPATCGPGPVGRGEAPEPGRRGIVGLLYSSVQSPRPGAMLVWALTAIPPVAIVPCADRPILVAQGNSG